MLQQISIRSDTAGTNPVTKKRAREEEVNRGERGSEKGEAGREEVKVERGEAEERRGEGRGWRKDDVMYLG